MAFEHIVTTRFFDIDRAGIVFFGRFFDYCHAACEELLMAMFGNLEVSFQRGDWTMPVVHSEADFKHPVRMGEILRISVMVERLGEKSVTFVYDIRNNNRGVHHATLKLVHVFIDLATFEARRVPTAFRQALERVGVLAR